MLLLSERYLSFITVECAVTIYIESLMNQIELLTTMNIFFQYKQQTLLMQ